MRRSLSVVSIQPPDPPFWTKTSWLQLGYGIWVNMNVIGIGLCFGFPAVTIPQLRGKESSIQITLREEAWIVSILTLSSPIGSLLCGLLMDRYGRRLVLILCELPMCFGWFFMGFASSARDLIIGRVIGGVGLGMALTAPRAYITEITLPNMRGVIGALPNLFISLGLTFTAAIGSFVNWYILCYICGSYTLVMMISNVFLPETPYFLLMKSASTHYSISYAKVNLKRFRSSRFNVEAELTALYDFGRENNFRRLSLKEQIKALFKPSACKPYGIATVYFIFMQLAGVNVVIMWAVEMLEASKSSINANLGNFLLAFTRIVIGLLTSVLLYKVGRRVLAMVSAIGVGVMALLLCVFLYTAEEKSILPLLIFVAYIAFATLGYYTLPFLMMFELLPLQIRGLLSGICISQLNFLMFAMNNCYPLMRQTLGLQNVMAMFGGFSLLGALILYFILPETKGLTLQEIEEFFNSRRSTLVSQRRVMSDQLNDLSRMSLRRSKSNVFDKKAIEKKLRERAKSRTSFTKPPKLKEAGLKINSMESMPLRNVNKTDKPPESNKVDNTQELQNKEVSLKDDLVDKDNLIKNDENDKKDGDSDLVRLGKYSADEERVLASSSQKTEDDSKDEKRDLVDNEKDSKDGEKDVAGGSEKTEDDLKNKRGNSAINGEDSRDGEKSFKDDVYQILRNENDSSLNDSEAESKDKNNDLTNENDSTTVDDLKEVKKDISKDAIADEVTDEEPKEDVKDEDIDTATEKLPEKKKDDLKEVKLDISKDAIEAEGTDEEPKEDVTDEDKDTASEKLPEEKKE